MCEWDERADARNWGLTDLMVELVVRNCAEW